MDRKVQNQQRRESGDVVEVAAKEAAWRGCAADSTLNRLFVCPPEADTLCLKQRYTLDQLISNPYSKTAAYPT